MDSTGSSESQRLAKTRLNGMAILLMIVSILQALEPSPPLQSLVSHELGITWIKHIENAPSQVWQDLFRMRKRCFDLLCTWLTQRTKLLQRSTKIPLRERVMMFLYLVCQGASRRTTGHIFGRAGATVQRLVLIYHKPIKEMYKIY